MDGSACPFWSIVNLMDEEDELECKCALNVRFGECQGVEKPRRAPVLR